MDNRSFLRGASDLFDVFDTMKDGQPEGLVRYTQNRIADMIVPGAVSQFVSGADPSFRSNGTDSYPAGLLDAIENRIPGLSNDNAPVRDALGRTQDSAGDPVTRSLSPFRMRDARNDPVVAAIRENGASLGRLQRRIKIDGVATRLNDQQWDDYQRIAGELTRSYIQEEISAQEWHDMDADERRRAINQAKKDARADARAQLLGDGTGDDGGEDQ